MQDTTGNTPTPPTLRHEWSGADWLEHNLAAAKRLRRKIATKGEVSPLGRIVADVLGLVYRGLYHLDDRALMRVDWSDDYIIQIAVPKDLAIWDFDELTQLVVVCHDLCLRLSVSPHGPRSLKLTFHQRDGREGPFTHRLPTMEDHVEMIRSLYTATEPGRAA